MVAKDWAAAQAYLRVRGAHMSFCLFCRAPGPKLLLPFDELPVTDKLYRWPI